MRSDLQTVRELGAAIEESWIRMTESLTPVVAEMARAVQGIYDAWWHVYVADGAIYGETDAGMYRWLKERLEIERLQMEANYLEERQAMVRDFRRMIEAKRHE